MYTHVSLGWLGVERDQYWESDDVSVEVSCPSAAFFPAQCVASLQTLWMTFLFLICMLSFASVFFSRRILLYAPEQGKAAR